jgi:uncharacterized membrane protein YphA (DoxX/SURF4 family)
VIGTVAAVIVGVAFVVAGASKLAAGDQWPAQARALGAPESAITPLPWVELGVGALLVAQVARRAVAVLAVALLIAFTVLIVQRLREGRHPPCACFGAWSAKPLGPGHLARNAVLIAVGLVAVAG